jgi:hypothetical protein
MKLLVLSSLLLISFASCKVVRIEGTPSVKVTNSTTDAIPVVIENTTDVQKVAVISSIPANDKKGKPFVKTSNDNKPLELAPTKGHYLIIDYLSAGISSEDVPKLNIKTEGFNIDLPLQLRSNYYTYAERVQYIVLEGQKLTISTTRVGFGSKANIYVAGNEMVSN